MGRPAALAFPVNRDWSRAVEAGVHRLGGRHWRTRLVQSSPHVVRAAGEEEDPNLDANKSKRSE
jgi:hypothetical protein